MSGPAIPKADEFVVAVVEELDAACSNPEFGGGPPEILAPAIRARDKAIIEAACGAVCRKCRGERAGGHSGECGVIRAALALLLEER